MIEELEFKKIVANNITMYRKANGLTQIQLAEKLNYSDKAISKWERGESLPDVYILQIIAEMFGITLNDLVTKASEPKKNANKLNKHVVLLLSIGLTWLIAVITYAVLSMVGLDFAYMPFVYSLPVSFIVTIVFSKLWEWRKLLFISISALYYTIPLAVCFQLMWKYNCVFLFLIAIPLQILTILWFFRKK